MSDKFNDTNELEIMEVDDECVQRRPKLLYIIPKEGKDMMRTIEEKFAKKAITLKAMIENTSGNDDSIPIELVDIPVKVLDKVIEYLIYHFDDPISEPTEPEDENYDEVRRSDNIGEWDRNFMADVDYQTMFGIIETADYLQIKGLTDLGCKTAANQIRGKSAEEVRQLWNIRNDLTDEEEQLIRQENEWAEES